MLKHNENAISHDLCSESDTCLSSTNKTYEDAIVYTALITCEHAAVNTDVITYEDATTNTSTITCEEATNTIQPALVSRETMALYDDFAVSHSTQATLSFSHIGYNNKVFCDAGTMKELDYSIPFCIEQIQNDDNAVRFYTGFPTYKVLMACFIFWVNLYLI